MRAGANITLHEWTDSRGEVFKIVKTDYGQATLDNVELYRRAKDHFDTIYWIPLGSISEIKNQPDILLALLKYVETTALKGSVQ